METDGERIDAYVSDEMDRLGTESFEEALRTAPSPARELVADQLAMDRALKRLLVDEDGDDSERKLVSSVTGHLTRELREGGPRPLALRVVAGPQIGRTHKLEEGELVIGRSIAADLTIADTGASREHARIIFRTGTIQVVDLGSRNGVLLNGERIKGEAAIGLGDHIRIGKTVIAITELQELAEYRLVCLRGPAAGKEWNLLDRRTTIGRGEQADIVLPDQAASRVHSAFVRNGDGIELEDLGSHNGTALNGHPITGPTRLRLGDRVGVGACVFEFSHGHVEGLSGVRLDGFVVLDRVSIGGTGIVYQARNSDTDALVAVTFLDPERTASGADRARFLNTIRNLRRQRDTHLVPILGEGSHEDLIYLVRPWIENGSLADLCSDPNDLPDPTIVCALALDAARGLATGAAAGLHHGSLRCSDVLIDADGHGLVANLGLAPVDNALVERLGSPEAAVLHRFGRLLYEGLTGLPPQAPPVPPRELNPAIGRPLQDLVLRLLGDTAIKRYGDWHRVIAELDKAVSVGARSVIRKLQADEPLVAGQAPVVPAPVVPAAADVAPSPPAPASPAEPETAVIARASSHSSRRRPAVRSSRQAARSARFPTSIILLLVGVVLVIIALLALR